VPTWDWCLAVVGEWAKDVLLLVLTHVLLYDELSVVEHYDYLEQYHQDLTQYGIQVVAVSG